MGKGVNKKLITLISSTISLAIPVAALAFVADAIPRNVNISIANVLSGVFAIVWPVVVAVIIIMFIVAGFEFLTAQGAPEKLKLARSAVIWGIAGVMVIVLAFSIITIVRITLGGGAL